ncbi:MAG: bifunctional UDP-N-acetylglucosamine diphosphorylase/glucosamine-1-phosphate N-acetyltransferase GlmU [Actinomycetales bacterium]|nr:bifunctional UDP-N-acetylglucosamine diphosphorylase/glucosamine-1-phosphate N-acetyltransferase GlmU [Actinomycetales bacterium]
MTSAAPVVIVLAAGEGKRMKSATPKVLHRIAGRSLVGHVLEAAAAIEPAHLMVVVGHGRDEVVAHLDEIAPWADTVVQAEQHGTGHAVRLAVEALAAAGALGDGPIIVLSGDTPLLTGGTVTELLARHRDDGAAATLLSATVMEPDGYGRVVRDRDGWVDRIVEHRDADEATRAIDEINAGMYAFDPADLLPALGRLTTANDQGEEYLTDVIGLMREAGRPVAALRVPDSDEILGVNDRVQLAEAAALMRDRINRRWMLDGVSMLDPASTWIDVDVDLAPDVTLLPQTSLLGPTSVASGARIGPGTTLSACEVGSDADVRHTWADLAVIGPGASIGPYSYLRPGTRIGAGAKVGAYVEMKNSSLGDGAKVPHLSYVGDAEIGEGTNIGAATVFVNYDGVEKHSTVVGRYVRIGSDTMLIAPLTVGDGAYTAAGSVVTDDVPPGAMAVGRARQRTIPGWVERRRAGSDSARAAAEALAESPPPVEEENR